MTLSQVRAGGDYYIPTKAGHARITRFIGYRYSKQDHCHYYDLEVRLNKAVGYISLPETFSIEGN